MSKNYFIPNADPEYAAWILNIKRKLPNYVTQFGIKPAKVTEANTLIDTFITKLSTSTDAEKAYLKAAEIKNLQRANTTEKLLKIINFMKGNEDEFTTAIGKDLAILTQPVNSVDVENFKPVITAVSHPGYVRIAFKNKGVDGINIYKRRKGEADFLFLARDTKSPYDDKMTMPTPPNAEVYEYMAIGVVADNEIGVASDIVAVSFGA